MKNLLAVILVATSLHVVAQSSEKEQINKGVYNRLEFFINSQLTDSVYNLANADFKKQVPLSKLAAILTQDIYPQGRILNTESVDYKDGIAVYRIDFGKTSYDLFLA